MNYISKVVKNYPVDGIRHISEVAESYQRSGIRDMFDLATQYHNLINFGVGEPNFETPKPY